MNTRSPTSASRYRPPPHQHSLFQDHCGLCDIEDICGEAHTETACGDPAEYADSRFHPTAGPVPAQELLLPNTETNWGDIDFNGRASLVVASEVYPPLDAYGVDLRTAIQKGKATQADLAVAFLFGRDQDLERAWVRRGRLGRDLKTKRYRAAVAPAYSTWHDDTPYAGAVSIARTAEVARALAPQIPTIPSVVWRTGVDIQRQIRYLAQSGITPWIAVDLGRSEESIFDWLLEGLDLLRRGFTEESEVCPKLVAYGLGTPIKIGRVLALWPSEVVVASQVPYLVAINGSRLDHSLTRIEAPEYKRQELIELNARIFEEVAVACRVHPVALQEWSTTA